MILPISKKMDPDLMGPNHCTGSAFLIFCQALSVPGERFGSGGDHAGLGQVLLYCQHQLQYQQHGGNGINCCPRGKQLARYHVDSSCIKNIITHKKHQIPLFLPTDQCHITLLYCCQYLQTIKCTTLAQSIQFSGRTIDE